MQIPIQPFNPVEKLFQGMLVVELYEQAAASCAEDSAGYKGER